MTAIAVPIACEYSMAVTVIDSVVTSSPFSDSDIVGSQRFDTDPTGKFNLTLTNVVVGSRIHVEKQSDGTQYHDSVAADSTVEIQLNAYAVGNANNDLRIKVRKGSASPKYQPFETFVTAVVGSAAVYVAQIQDTIAS